MNPALFFLLFSSMGDANFPPLGTAFWITNLGDYVVTNLGQRIVFKPAAV